MAQPTAASGAPPAAERLHAAFLDVLPRVQTHARFWFRHVACPGRRDDFVSEAVALAWKWFRRAAERGKDPGRFAGALASLAVKAVRSGRRLCGQERARDVLSPLAQRRRGFAVECLHASPTTPGLGCCGNPRWQDYLDAFEERLRDNTQTPVFDQVVFRCDFRDWLAALPDRDRRVAAGLMAGGGTGEVAREVGLSPGRVSQLRRELHGGWLAFCGGPGSYRAGGAAR
jgi:hypothetical protein